MEAPNILFPEQGLRAIAAGGVVCQDTAEGG